MKKKGFLPIVDNNSRVLILGTFPGPLSLELRQYYAHPGNIFWRIMASLLEFEINARYSDRVRILKNSEIAVWDVLASCKREGAADQNIQKPVANNFKSFFDKHKNLTRVFFNGRAAERLFYRLVQPRGKVDRIRYDYLPSTSPANTGILFENKLVKWRSVVDDKN